MLVLVLIAVLAIASAVVKWPRRAQSKLDDLCRTFDRSER